MNYEEFQRQLGKAGLSIREFAALIKMRHNSISNYSKRGEVPSHLALIAALLGEMGEHRIDFRKVISSIEIDKKRARGGGFANKASQ